MTTSINQSFLKSNETQTFCKPATGDDTLMATTDNVNLIMS